MRKEMQGNLDSGVAPFTGAWIEIVGALIWAKVNVKSHPSRVRGLKYI